MYSEGGARCRRNGSGAPSLCRSHRIVLEDAARNRRPGAGVAGVIFDVFSGRPVTGNRVADAVEDLFDMFGFGRAAAAAAAGPEPQWPPGWARGAGSERPPRPPHAPDARRAAVLAARTKMGFGPTEPLDEATLKERRRELAKKCHPDVAGGSLARMTEINEAFNVLITEVG